MTAHTDSATKAKREVALFFCVWWTWSNVPIGIEMPRGVEVCRIFPVDIRVAVQLPNVGDADRAFRDEHSFVPIVLSGSVCHPKQIRSAPLREISLTMARM
jgi:hypothetical protein